MVDFRCASRCFALALWICLPGSASAEVSVDVTGLKCPDAARTRDLIKSLVEQSSLPGNLSVVLDSRPPSQLVVHLNVAGTASERVIPCARSDCPQVAYTVAFLVRSLVSRRWDNPPPPAETAKAEEAAEPPPGEARIEPPASRHSPLALLVGAGYFVQPADGRGSLTVAVAGEASLSSRWGLGGEARYEAPLRVPHDGGEVGAAVWRLAALARLQLLAFEAAALHVLAGPTLSVIQESSSGFASTRGGALVDAGAAAALRWDQRLAGALSVFGSIELQVRATEERLALRNTMVQDVMTVPRVRTTLLVGAQWDPL